MSHRILVVDDDPQILQLFRKILTRAGYSVTAEISGKRALQLLKNDEPVELLVLDLDMPEPDGFEILRAMRILRPELKIVVISGYLGGALLKTSELLGAATSLSKSDAPNELLDTVKALLS
jgi:CheY-like chemotaxis protein